MSELEAMLSSTPLSAGNAPYVEAMYERFLTDPQSVDAVLKRLRPWAVINAAGYVRVDQAEKERERCFLENAYGAEMLALACARLDTPYVAFSSDLVFDGMLGRAYVESDAVCPTCVYGHSKATAERLVQKAFPEALVVRTSAFFSPWDRYNFVHTTLRALQAGKPVAASDAVMVSPTYVPDLVHTALDLLWAESAGAEVHDVRGVGPGGPGIRSRTAWMWAIGIRSRPRRPRRARARGGRRARPRQGPRPRSRGTRTP